LFQDLSPKPSYQAAKALQQYMGYGGFMGRLPSVPNDSEDVFVLQFAGFSMGTYAYAVWTNVSSCTSPETRKQCGNTGISEGDCVTLGCCFDETGKEPQCYSALPPKSVSFRAVSVNPSQCYYVVQLLGQKSPNVCASGNILTLLVNDGPTYVFPYFP